MDHSNISVDDIKSDPAVQEEASALEGNEVFSDPQVETGSQTQSQEQEKQPESKAPEQPAAPAITPEMLSTAVAQGVTQATQAPAQPEVDPFDYNRWTPEQRAQNFKLPQVSAADLKSILGVEEVSAAQANALQSVINSIVESATRIAVVHNTYASNQHKGEFQKFQQDISGKIDPIQAQIAASNQEQLANRFYAAHPDLKKWDAAVKEVYQAMIARGEKFPDEQTAFKAVADNVRKIQQAFVAPESPQNGQAPAGSPAPRNVQTKPAQVNMAGNSGGSLQQTSNVGKPAGIEVF